MKILSDFREHVQVKFPVTSGKSNVTADYIQTEDMIRTLEWERSKITEDLRREEQLLDYAMANFTNEHD